MPNFVYQPEGAEPREWPWEPYKMSSKDAELIEEKTGLLFGEWVDAAPRGSIKALRALLFVLLRRDTPGLQYDHLQFTTGDVYWRLSDDERTDRVLELTRAARDRDLTDDETAVLDSYRESLPAKRLEKVDATLAAETAEGEPEDPTPLASVPESAPAAVKPEKKTA